MPSGNDTNTSSPMYGVSIADSSIANSKLADGSISTQKVLNNSITTPKIADTSITTSKLADASITTDKIADGAITATEIANGTITYEKLSPVNTSGSAAISQTKTSAGSAYTNSSFTIVTIGRPVLVFLNGLSSTSCIQVVQASGTNVLGEFAIRRDGIAVGGGVLSIDNTNPGGLQTACPCGALFIVDTPSAGSHTYDVYLNSLTATSSAIITNATLVAIEL